MTPTLRDYQHEALGFVMGRKSSGLFLDMGLGKTAITLHTFTPDRLPALVTAPMRPARDTWPAEAAKWRPDLTVALAHGSPAKRKAALASGADIVVIARDSLADAVPVSDRFASFVVDESSGFKSQTSNRWKAANKIRRQVRHTVILSGTPTPKGLLDLYPQVKLLDGGERLGKTLSAYRNRYFSPGQTLPSGVVTEWHLKPGADQRIHELVSDLCISMETEGRVELPPTTYNTVRVPLPPKVRKVYETMKQDLVADIDVLGLDGVVSAANAAVLSSKLSQVAAGFIYEDEQTDGAHAVLHDEKAKALREIVDGTGSPVLVFYRFKAELQALQRAFPESDTVKSPDAVERWNAGKIPVMFAHPASAGMGLNLQDGGHTMVWSSAPWSLEEYMQSNKRLARSGQRHPVVIHHLTATDTVDEAVLSRLAGRKTVQDALLEHLKI